MSQHDTDMERLLAQAKLGLEALIDEATGYQKARPKGALAKRYREFGGSDDDYRAPDALPDA